MASVPIPQGATIEPIQQATGAPQSVPIPQGSTIEALPQGGAEQPKEGFFKSLGNDLLGMVKNSPHMLPPVMAYDKAKEFIANYESVRDTGKTLAEHDADTRAKAGHGFAYQVGAGVNEQLGVNVKGMERAADRGDMGGVLGHAAAVPAAALLTEGAIRGGTALANAAKPAAAAASESLYRSALKPTTVPAQQANVAAAIDTGLKEGIPVSPKGAEKLSQLVDDLNNKIKNEIGAGQGKTVNKFKVASRLSDTADKFDTQVNPEADAQAIADSGNEFLRNQPEEIPAARAQALKQGTYRILRKKYGQLGDATVESQKALARGIKEELVNQFPELQGLNAQESQLLRLDPLLEKAVARIGNHQMIGIGTPIAAGGIKAATGSTGLAAAAGTLKLILDNPVVKSNLAIALNRASKGKVTLSGATARVAAYSAALNSAASGGSHDESDAQSK